MRLHITLDDALVRELDRRVGPRRRSAFVASAVQRALEDEQRWELIWSVVGSVPDEGHEWDADAAAWVASERRGETARVG